MTDYEASAFPAEGEATATDDDAFQWDALTLIYLGAHIKCHLENDVEMRESLAELAEENDIDGLASALLERVRPLLASRKASDVSYAIAYVVRQAWQKGVRDGLTESYIQCAALAAHAAEDDEGGISNDRA